MADSTSSISGSSSSFITGLSSGIDWSTMINELIAVDQQRVTLVSNQQSSTQTKLQAWQSFNTQLLSLKTAADALQYPKDFTAFKTDMSSDSGTVAATDLLSVSTSDTATLGNYTIRVDSLAQAQKLSSNPFTSAATALGSSYAGDIVINGKVVTIKATDTLADVAASINKADTGASPSGVTATIVNFGANNSRLILTSDATGAKGIGLLNGSSVNLVQQFGWKDNQTATMKNSITNGGQSDRFISSTVAVKSLLGLVSGESGDVTIGNRQVTLNLGTMSLTDVKNAINAAAPTGVTASVILETENGDTYYRLRIDGTQTLSDTNNILNTLGVLDHTSNSTTGKISGNSMTSGGSYITASTLLKNIAGYNTFTAGGNPAGDYITLTGKDSSNGDVNVNFNITSSTTVQDLLEQINTSYGNVLAYVTSDGKIRVDDLSGNATTNVNVNLNPTIHASGSSLDFGVFGSASAEMVAGKDATVEVEGVPVTKASNIVDGVIPGVTLNLLKADESTTINLKVSRDVDAIKNKINSFVTAYNTVSAYINTQNSYDTKSNTPGGVLFGDGTLSSVKSELTSLIAQPIWGVNTSFSIMGLAGINLDKKGQLSVNDATLTGYLQTNFNDIMSLFVGQGTTSSSTLSYAGDTQKSKAGEYAVHINTAAKQSTSTSLGAVGGTLGSNAGDNEIITITAGNKSAAVSLTYNMTIDDITNAINNELSTEYTQKLAGGAQLTSSGTSITSQTAWKDIDGTSLQNGDVISFSGTSRGGAAVTGSYTINSVATDTVQGLLSAIDNAFSNDVTASVDSLGRITVEDNYSGSSKLTLDITEPGGRGLDFGTVSKTNTGGQTGRYALDVTAARDGSNHLVFTSNNYGSSYTFTLSETNKQLLWGGDQTVNNGADVAGTIGGEAATGSGQVLSGKNGNANTEGLSVRYTGAVENVDAGTIKLTRGVADLFDRTLFGITDAYAGYVSLKETSLQNNIDNFQTRIDEMNAQLAQKKQQMTNEFVAMETALNQIKNVSNWFAGQVTAAASGWKL
jgi:flagellar hook-associated protein 2